MEEIIDFSALSFDDAVKAVMKVTGMDEADATMMVAISRGEIDGDIIELEG